jgi:anaerobic magnesium-protoporphyrin IX monomethyl ester cyclase
MLGTNNKKFYKGYTSMVDSIIENSDEAKQISYASAASSLQPTSRTGKTIIFMPETGEGSDTLTPPLGTLAIAGYLENKGLPIFHIDQRVEPDAKQIIMECIREGALCIGMGFGTGPQITHVIELSQAIKDEFPGFPIIWGGWHPSILVEQCMEHPAVDIVVRGQGEVSMYELVNRLREGIGFEDLAGIAHKVAGKTIINPERPMDDLNSFPNMPYHLINFKDYPGPPNRRSSPEDKFSNFRSSQGCPWRCAYCADPLVFNRRWKALSAERTVDELENLAKNYGITYVDFVDDTFIVDPKRVKAFAEEMIKRKVPLKWSANARTGMIAKLDQEVLDLLHESGCDLLHPGVEASTQEMLDYILKDEKNGNTLIAAEKMKKADITGLYAFMVSFPDDPEDMVDATFRMVRELKELNANNIMPVNFYVPYPGNVLYDRAQEKGFIPPTKLEQWAEFGTRLGSATPWITKEYRDRVMMMDKYLLPAAYPSRLLKYRMQNSRLSSLYKLLHHIAIYRVKKELFGWALDWKLVYAYWKFWEKWNRRVRLPNLMFR